MSDDESEPVPARVPAHNVPFHRKANCPSDVPWSGDVDELTLQYAREDHRAAFERLVMLHHRSVYRFVGVALGPKRREAAGALTIDTFVEAERRLKSFIPGGNCRFWTWLYAQAWEVVQEAPKRALHDARAPRTSAPQGDSKPAPNASVSTLWKRFDGLPQEQRIAALLLIEGYSIVEMAQIMKTTPAVARVQAERACRALRERGVPWP